MQKRFQTVILGETETVFEGKEFYADKNTDSIWSSGAFWLATGLLHAQLLDKNPFQN